MKGREVRFKIANSDARSDLCSILACWGYKVWVTAEQHGLNHAFYVNVEVPDED